MVKEEIEEEIKLLKNLKINENENVTPNSIGSIQAASRGKFLVIIHMLGN